MKPYKKKNSSVFQNYSLPVLCAVILITAGVLIARKGTNTDSPGTVNDIVIDTNTITGTVQFFPVKVGKTRMEVMAVKASDGTIRTAFNTCQVCNGSPRAYYEQQGELIVCRNCGNRFSMDMIEVQRGGCNPVPIAQDEKTDDGDIITIPADTLVKNKGLFTDNWKSQ